MPNPSAVKLSDSLSIRDANVVHEQLKTALSEADSVELFIPSDAEVDLSFVQIVESARLEADVAGKTLELAAPAENAVRSIIERGGFLTAGGNGDRSFWTHEEADE